MATLLRYTVKSVTRIPDTPLSTSDAQPTMITPAALVQDPLKHIPSVCDLPTVVRRRETASGFSEPAKSLSSHATIMKYWPFRAVLATESADKDRACNSNMVVFSHEVGGGCGGDSRSQLAKYSRATLRGSWCPCMARKSGVPLQNFKSVRTEKLRTRGTRRWYCHTLYST